MLGSPIWFRRHFPPHSCDEVTIGRAHRGIPPPAARRGARTRQPTGFSTGARHGGQPPKRNTGPRITYAAPLAARHGRSPHAICHAWDHTPPNHPPRLKKSRSGAISAAGDLGCSPQCAKRAALASESAPHTHPSRRLRRRPARTAAAALRHRPRSRSGSGRPHARKLSATGSRGSRHGPPARSVAAKAPKRLLTDAKGRAPWHPLAPPPVRPLYFLALETSPAASARRDRPRVAPRSPPPRSKPHPRGGGLAKFGASNHLLRRGPKAAPGGLFLRGHAAPAPPAPRRAPRPRPGRDLSSFDFERGGGGAPQAQIARRRAAPSAPP